jgi:hypothetical protein
LEFFDYFTVYKIFPSIKIEKNLMSKRKNNSQNNKKEQKTTTSTGKYNLRSKKNNEKFNYMHLADLNEFH